MMLNIRKEQMQAFEGYALLAFAERTVDYLQKSVPIHYKILGRDRIRETVQEGLKRAAHYGLTTENSLLFYIHLMFIFGSFFDVDPQLPWANEILTDQSIQDEALRIHQLNMQVSTYLEIVAGKDNIFLNSALHVVRQTPLRALAVSGVKDSPRSVAEPLRRIYPQKYEFIGEEGVKHLASRGLEAAKRYGIGDELGAAVYTGLMFIVGSYFDADPQFAWAAGVLMNDSLVNPTQKIERLHQASIEYLDRWIR